LSGTSRGDCIAACATSMPFGRFFTIATTCLARIHAWFSKKSLRMSARAGRNHDGDRRYRQLIPDALSFAGRCKV
jgi:hypothetical protein